MKSSQRKESEFCGLHRPCAWFYVTRAKGSEKTSIKLPDVDVQLCEGLLSVIPTVEGMTLSLR